MTGTFYPWKLLQRKLNFDWFFIKRIFDWLFVLCGRKRRKCHKQTSGVKFTSVPSCSLLCLLTIMPLRLQRARTTDERLEEMTRQVHELGSVVESIKTLLAEKQQKLDEARETAKLTQAQFEKLTRNQETIMACLLKAFPQVNFDELNTPRTDGETRPLFFCFLLFLFQCLFVCLFVSLS